MIANQLLTEIERQEKYLKQLPQDFTYPLFNSKQALESQRRNGYRNTAAAAREIVDNALEAGAKKIHVVFDRPTNRKAHQRQDAVSAIAFIDDGSGMIPKMARYALSWGGGTHFDDSDFIGKFGFGLPNASINQTRRVEVYTKTKGSSDITKAWLDATEVQNHGVQSIPEPVKSDLPEFVKRHLAKRGMSFEHGTVVVWIAPDRLTYRTGASLKEHLVDDFAVTYRYLLGDIELEVEGVQVQPVDPLFLTPGARYYAPPEQDGAQLVDERSIPVAYFKDQDTGEPHLRKLEDKQELESESLLATGSIYYRIARFPVGFAAQRGEGDAKRRFDVRKSRRGMSFVRAGREIETVDAFPRSARDTASGLGDWPLLQSYAYHWGIELRFSPSLDEVFGITNDKQTVRPIEDFWRLLAKEEIDKALHRENAWQVKHREKKVPEKQPSEGPTPAELAAAAADTIAGRKPTVPDHDKANAKAGADEEARKRAAGVTPESKEEALKAIEAEVKRRPYRVDYHDDPNGPFYEPSWVGSQVLIRINRQHPFYTTLYGELLRLPGGTRALQAVDVLLIGLGKAELTVDDETAKLWYEQQRKSVWSPFLANALKVLAQSLRPTEEPDDQAPANEAPSAAAA